MSHPDRDPEPAGSRWRVVAVGTLSAVACAMALTIAVDSLVLSGGEWSCEQSARPGTVTDCLRAFDEARSTDSVPGTVLLSLIAGVGAWLAMRDHQEGPR